MYYILALISGLITAIMIVCNGKLNNLEGIYSANAIIHFTGLCCITLILLIRRENPFKKRVAWYGYLGGAAGVVVTIFQNVAFGRISVSAILALCLLGQCVMSILADRLELIHKTKKPFRKSQIVEILFILCGIIVMISDVEVLAVFFAFFSGVALIVTRIFNANLATSTSHFVSTFFNFVVGFSIAIILMAFLGRAEPFTTQWQFHGKGYMYVGGLIGVVVVLLSNMVANKISSFNMTLFIFVGQMFTGVVLDTILTGQFYANNLLGACLVTAGLLFDLIFERKEARNA